MSEKDEVVRESKENFVTDNVSIAFKSSVDKISKMLEKINKSK